MTGCVPLTLEDVPALLALEKSCFGAEGFSAPQLRQMLTARYGLALGLWEEELLVGAVLLEVLVPESELHSLAVQPAKRSRGLGSVLLKSAITEARKLGANEMFLEVRSSNQAAIALYERAGFTPLSVRRGYYSQPREDALVMHMRLSSPSPGPVGAEISAS
ncbi:ribosomal protein S18-alanine N-acetyltransferase [Varibaculum prostatecancerukia]|uniref:ribosomal protein S18-alanine N-acetyltransferase n=1 Tax=Varibaculum prostatecancerukia TaxID=2811781 RepID=UPI001C000C8E|nr:ribosomal protein S18-alanine N-acetyltransferase [Varibaculum prostatecancerukia]